MELTRVLGYTDEGYRVKVTAKVKTIPGTQEDMQTHEPVTGITQLSLTGDMEDTTLRVSHHNRYVACGQILDDLSSIVNFSGSLTKMNVERIEEIWRDYHLNDLTAHCAHMDLSSVPADLPAYAARGETSRSSWMLDNLVCPVTGYRYGTKWLVRDIPQTILDELTSLISKGE